MMRLELNQIRKEHQLGFFYKSSYQQPKIPEIRGDCAEHLQYCSEQDDVLEVSKTRIKWINYH